MALVNVELIKELRDAAEAYVREEVERVTGIPLKQGHDVFTPDNLAIATGSPRPAVGGTGGSTSPVGRAEQGSGHPKVDAAA